MALEDLCKLGVALGRKHRDRMPDDPDQEAGEPQPEAQPDRGRDRADDDCDPAGGAGEQDRLGEGMVQRHLESFDAHWTSAPPPKAKNARKKLVAAKAIVSP